MKYCNPIQDFSAYLCDIPAEWRSAIVEALNCVYSSVLSANLDVEANGNCEGIQDCQTNTQFNTTLVNNILTATYVNEKNITIIKNTDLTDAINEALDGVNPGCLMTQEEWDVLTYQERLNAIFDKVCCVHGDCAGLNGSGCGCEDCGDEDVECIGLTACPCVTYEVSGTAPYTFTYKDCDTKEITEFESLENNIVQICAIRGTVITPDGVFCNEILDECSDLPITTTTTSSSTTSTTTEPTTTTTTTSTSSTSSTTTTTTILPPPTTTTSTTSSTTTTTTILPPPTTTTSTSTTSTSSTTTTSSSTTTTTTISSFWTYYLADEYLCDDCSLFNDNILVRLPSSHTVQVGKFYIPVIFAGLVYNIISSVPQVPGGSVTLTTDNYTTCGAACAGGEGIANTTTRYSNDNSISHCSEPNNTVYTEDGQIFSGNIAYTDIGMTTPLTGYTFISDSMLSVVYHLDNVTGLIGANSGAAC